MLRLALLLTLLPFLPAAARDVFELPARFVRIHTIDEMTAPGHYAIGAVDGGKLYLMRRTAAASRGKLSVARAGSLQEAYTLTRDENCWLLNRSGSGWTLQPTSADTWLSPKGNNDFEWTSKPAVWTIEARGDGTFRLAAAQQADRFVGVSSTDTYYFGRYISDDSCKHLYIYKVDSEKAVAPAAGSLTALCLPVRDRLYALEAGSLALTDTRGVHLANDTLAPGGDYTPWRADYVDGDTFRLTGPEGLALRAEAGRLTTTATAGATGTRWCVTDGRITTAVAKDDDAAVLCARQDGTTFSPALCSAAEFATNGARPLVFRPVGDAPTASTDAQGTLRLAGAWSADELAALATDSVAALDLTAISLPRQAPTLTPAHPNMLIYVRAGETGYVPDDWPNTVGVGPQGNCAIRPVELHDGFPFHTPYAFTAAQGVSYERTAHADGGWETLTLPFAAALPEGFAAETCTAVEGTEILFAPVDRLEANSPVILTYTGEAGAAGVPLRLTATGVTVDSRTTDTASPLVGNYTAFTVGGNEGRCYLLDASGTVFVLADATSTLSPFRAYLATSLSATAATVRHIRPTGIRPTETDAATPALFGLDGRRLSGTNRERSRIVISGGKKYIHH